MRDPVSTNKAICLGEDSMKPALLGQDCGKALEIFLERIEAFPDSRTVVMRMLRQPPQVHRRDRPVPTGVSFGSCHISVAGFGAQSQPVEQWRHSKKEHILELDKKNLKSALESLKECFENRSSGYSKLGVHDDSYELAVWTWPAAMPDPVAKSKKSPRPPDMNLPGPASQKGMQVDDNPFL